MQIGESIYFNIDLDTNKLSIGVKDAKGLMTELRKSLDNTAESLPKFQRKVDHLGHGFRDFMIMVSTARFAVLDFYDVFMRMPVSMVKSAGEMERMTKLMEGLSTKIDGAAKKAEALSNVRFVFDTALNAPFDVKTITDSFIKFKSAGLDPTNGSMQALIDSVAKFGGSSEQLHRSSIAIQQMAGKGVISMEELRQQLGEAVPTAMKSMAIGMGLSMAELNDKISKGMVGSKGALEKMFAVMNAENRYAAKDMMDTWTGLFEQLKTKWELFKNKMSSTGLFDEAKGKLKELLEGFDQGTFEKMGADVSYLATKGIEAFSAITSTAAKYYDELKKIAEIFAVGFAVSKIVGPGMDKINKMTDTYKQAYQKISEAEMKSVSDAREATKQRAAAVLDRVNGMKVELSESQKHYASLNEVVNKQIVKQKELQTMVANNYEKRGYKVSAVDIESAKKTISMMEANIQAIKAEAIAHKGRADELRASIPAHSKLVESLNSQHIAMGNVTNSARIMTATKAFGSSLWMAMGGWIGIATAALTLGISAWMDYASSAEQAAERSRRAAKGISDAAAKIAAENDKSKLDTEIRVLENSINNDELPTSVTGGGGLPQGRALSADKVKAVEEEIRQKKELREKLVKEIDQHKNNLSRRDIENTKLSVTKETQDKIEIMTRGYQSQASAQIESEESKLRSVLKKTKADSKTYIDAEKEANKRISSIRREFAIKTTTEEMALIEKNQADIQEKKKNAKNDELSGYVDAEIKNNEILVGLRERLKREKGIGDINGTEAKSKKEDGANSFRREESPIGSLQKYLNKSREELRSAEATQSRLLNEVDRADEIQQQVREKYMLMLENEQLSVPVKDKKGKIREKNLQGSFESQTDEVKGKINEAIDNDVKKLKIAESDKVLASATKNLKVEQLALADAQNETATSGQFVDQVSVSLRNEFEKQSEALRGIDNETTKAIKKTYEHRQALQAQAKALEYSRQAMVDAEQTNIDLEQNPYKRAQKEYERTQRLADEQFQKRRQQALAASEDEFKDGQTKEQVLADLDRARAQSEESARRRYEFNTRSGMQKLVDEWRDASLMIESASTGWMTSFSTKFNEMITTGKADWKGFILSMLSDLSQVASRKAFSSLYDAAFGNPGAKAAGASAAAAGTAAVAGAADEGGKATAGVFSSLVEKGKELWTSFFGVSDVAAKAASATGQSIAQTVAETAQGTTKLSAEQMQILMLNNLTTAAQLAANALYSMAATNSATSAASAGSGLLGTLLQVGMGAMGGTAAPAGGPPPGFGAGDLGTGIKMPTTGGVGAGLSFPGAGVKLFANGGIMTEFGSVALRKYANGGIANSPHMAIYGEGSMSEAFVPLPDGRSIPVTMKLAGEQVQGGGSGPVSIIINVTNNGEQSEAQGDDKGTWKVMAERVKDVVRSEIVAQRRPGGVLYR